MLSLECVLQHYYELRLEGRGLSDENRRLQSSMKSWQIMFERWGADRLLRDFRAITLNTQPNDRVLMPIVAGLFPDDVLVQTRILGQLKLQDYAYAGNVVAATFASTFFLHSVSGVGSILAERVLLGGDSPLVVLASREALRILGDYADRGQCSVCGRKESDASSSRWTAPKRVPKKLKEKHP